MRQSKSGNNFPKQDFNHFRTFFCLHGICLHQPEKVPKTLASLWTFLQLKASELSLLANPQRGRFLCVESSSGEVWQQSSVIFKHISCNSEWLPGWSFVGCCLSIMFDSLQFYGLYPAWFLVTETMGFPRQEYWSGLLFPSPGHLPNPRTEPTCPAFAGRFFKLWATRESQWNITEPWKNNEIMPFAATRMGLEIITLNDL